VTFNGSTSVAADGTSNGLVHEWDFSYDGTFNSEVAAAVVANTFSTLGIHTVALRVTDANGKSDIATVEITVAGGGTPGARKMHLLNVDADVDAAIVATPFHLYYSVRDQEGLPLSGLTQADFPTAAMVLVNQTTSTQLSVSTDYAVGPLVAEAAGIYAQEITLLAGAAVLPGDRVVADVQLVGTTPLADALGGTDGRVTHGLTQFRIAGGGPAPSGVFGHAVVQPSSPTIAPAATSYDVTVRFFDQAGAPYSPSAASNLTVVSAVNQDGVDYAPWTNPANWTVTFEPAAQEYSVSLANLSGAILGDRLYVTLRHLLEDGYVAEVSFGIEVRNVPPQAVFNPQYADPDFR